MDDPADPHVLGELTPENRLGMTRRHGLAFLDKLEVVRWLQTYYGITHDQAMRDADEFEKFLLAYS